MDVHIDIFEVVSIWMETKVNSRVTADDMLAHLRNTSYIRHQNVFCIFMFEKQNTITSKYISNAKYKIQIGILNTYFKYLYLKYYPALKSIQMPCLRKGVCPSVCPSAVSKRCKLRSRNFHHHHLRKTL